MYTVMIFAMIFIVAVAVWFDASAFYKRHDTVTMTQVFKDQLLETFALEGVAVFGVSIFAGGPFVIGGIKLLERTDIGYWILHAGRFEYNPMEPEMNIPYALVAILLMIASATVVRVILLIISQILGCTLRTFRRP